MEKNRILVIEDNADTRQFLETVLIREYEVLSAENGALGVEYARTRNPDLILLDVMMPGMSGFEVCELLKKEPKTRTIPILFLSAKNTVNNIIQELGIGAEDYLAKPFDYKELLARIHARLREKRDRQLEPKILNQGQLKINLDSRDVYFDGKRIDLTSTEYDILRLLIQKSGEVVARNAIVEEIWKEDLSSTQKRTIDVHIRSLRKKLPALTKHIISVYGVGYKFEK